LLSLNKNFLEQMNLRDQLKEILPDILPRNPAHAIKGTELIELVKYKLKQDYSDATLRYHFSIMSCDPSSPIAKVEHGQGYYLRSTTIHSLNSARNLIGGHHHLGSGDVAAMTSSDVTVVMARANKFRAVVLRYIEAIGQFPFAFEQSFSSDAAANRWKVPDLSVLQWLTTKSTDDDRLVIDQDRLAVYRRLASPPFRIASVKLRLDLNQTDLSEDLYQCLATSEWANTGELMIAASIEDPQMVEDIRRFSARYGIGVISFGLDADILDDMPEPAAVENLGNREFESIQSLFQMRRYASPTIRENFDWAHVSESAANNADFSDFEGWVSKCLMEGKMIGSREYLDLTRSSGTDSTQEYVA